MPLEPIDRVIKVDIFRVFRYSRKKKRYKTMSIHFCLISLYVVYIISSCSFHAHQLFCCSLIMLPYSPGLCQSSSIHSIAPVADLMGLGKISVNKSHFWTRGVFIFLVIRYCFYFTNSGNNILQWLSRNGSYLIDALAGNWCRYKCVISCLKKFDYRTRK